MEIKCVMNHVTFLFNTELLLSLCLPGIVHIVRTRTHTHAHVYIIVLVIITESIVPRVYIFLIYFSYLKSYKLLVLVL